MTDLVKKHETLSAYLEAEEQLLPKLKEKEFEDLVGLYLKTHDFFGPKVYSPNANEVPPHLAAKWNIINLLKGERSEGADYYTECLGGTGVEVKYQHDESSIKLHKLAVKEVALNKTNIKHRVLATNLSRVSSTIEDYLDNWTYVFGDDIYNEEVYQRIRNFVLQPRKKVKYKEVGYRPDSKINIGSTAFHYQSIKGLFDEIVAQIGLDGLARVLSIKPTAAGKGSDPILLWKHFLKSYFDKQAILTATINPSLTVLKGNLVKQTKDIKARGDSVRVVVLATDVSKGIEDAEELNLIKRYAEVVNGNEIIDVMLDWLGGNYHLHIETSIHSYWKLGEIMVAENITGDFMYIDEVKHSVQDEESNFAKCLFDKHGSWKVRVGADANIVEGKDEQDNQMPTSMRNDTLWRSLTAPGEISPVVWSENDVSSRGWKRKTTLEIHAYDVNLLPVEIQNAVYDKKSAIIKINGVMAPQEWLFKLDTLARYMLDHPNRKFPLLNLNTQKRVVEFIEFAKYAWPEVVGQYGDARNPMIRRMLDVPFVNIYSNGNTHNKIQRLVDGIPKTYTTGAVVCQVKKLSEGWDPEGGWVDGVMFVDASGSKTRISQTIGRGQRGPEALANVVIPETILVDPADQFSLKNQFKLIQSVAETLEIGEDNIEDCITFFDHINPGVPGAGRTKGSKYVKPLWELEGGLLGAFKGFVKEGTFNPHKNTVEEIFYKHSADILSRIKPGQAKVQKAVYEEVIQQYPDFFEQFKGHNGKRSSLTKILQGKHWLLDTKLKVKGRKQWREYLTNTKRGYLQTMVDLLAAARATVGKDSIETLLDDKGKRINWLNAMYKEFEMITGNVLDSKGIKDKYRNIAVGKGPCKNNYPWRNLIIAKAINSIYEQELAKSNALEAQQLEVLKTNLSKLVMFSANSIGWAVEQTTKETGAIQHRLNKASKQFRDMYPVWQEQNSKLAQQLYRDNWQRFETIAECDKYVEQTLSEQGFIVGGFQLREGIRKKLPEWKTMEKEIRLKAAAKTVKVRKKYDVWNKGLSLAE